MADECRHPTIDPPKEAPSQAAALGGPWPRATGRNSPGEEGATGKRAREKRPMGGHGRSYPAGFALAEAPAHAPTDDLLQLAAGRDGRRREVRMLRIDPSLLCHSNRQAVWQKATIS